MHLFYSLIHPPTHPPTHTHTHTPGDIIFISPEGETGEQGAEGGRKVQRQATTSSEVSSSIYISRLHSCYRFMVYAFQKTRQILVELLDLTWRFLELHLHKVVGLTLFATCLFEISALYWVLLALLLLLFPLSVLNFLTYPLITLYLGALSISKMVYQTPLIKSAYLDFPAATCDAPTHVSSATRPNHTLHEFLFVEDTAL